MNGMGWLQTGIAQGWLLDAVLAVFLVEAAALCWLARRAPRLQSVLRGWPTWAAGLGLLLAWRFASGHAHVAWVVLCLMAAGACHAVDLWQRLHQLR
jgi:hypothetical protein